MRTPVRTHVQFVRLDAAVQQFGAKSKQAFINDLRALSHWERREVANLVKQES